MDTVSLCLCGLFFGFVWLLNMWVVLRQKETHVANKETLPPLEINPAPFWDALDSTLSMAFGGFSKYQQPIDENPKNDDDEVFDEKRKRIEEDDEDESYWVVGDDGELVEKRKR